MTDVILSDVHDTLLDSRDIEIWGWHTWAAGHALDPAPFVSSHGLRAEDKLLRFAPHLSPAPELQLIASIAAACPHRAKAYDGAARLLSTTAKLALVTSGRREVVLSQLLQAGLTPPAVVVGGDDVARGKPNPDPFLRGAQLLGVLPADCVVLEDATPGVIGGVAAGMTVIAVATTTPSDELLAAGALLVVSNVADFVARRDAGVLPLARRR